MFGVDLFAPSSTVYLELCSDFPDRNRAILRMVEVCEVLLLHDVFAFSSSQMHDFSFVLLVIYSKERIRSHKRTKRGWRKFSSQLAYPSQIALNALLPTNHFVLFSPQAYCSPLRSQGPGMKNTPTFVPSLSANWSFGEILRGQIVEFGRFWMFHWVAPFSVPTKGHCGLPYSGHFRHLHE